MHGLNYTGYLDAVVQRWALMTDEYLVCTKRFALVRYEDFVVDPLGQAKRILSLLELSSLWRPGAEERIKSVAAMQYQTSSGRGTGPSHLEVFGEPLLTRIISAVRSRAERLGYGDLLKPHKGESKSKVSSSDWPPIEMPPFPSRKC